MPQKERVAPVSSRMIPLLFLAVMMVLFGTNSIRAGQVSVDYYFDRPQIEEVRIGSELYDRVVMTDAPNCGKAGQPALPGRNARILIPYGSEIESIEVIGESRIVLGDDYYIEPIARQYRLSMPPTEIQEPVLDQNIYMSDKPYPTDRYQSAGLQSFRGYSFLVLKLQPVEYLPTTGELAYYPRLTVIVNTADNYKSAPLYRGLEIDQTEVLSKIDNNETVYSYSSAPVKGTKSYDMLIITTPALASSFQPLKDYHDTTGIITEIHTTTEIGSTTPADVRDYIRERYLNDGIQYVLIGGDDDLIPARNLYVASDDGYWPEIETAMPSDVFFGCLDGTYNYDGDSNWGEPTDGEGGGDVDLVAEVYIGRAAVGNATEAERFVNKTIGYLNCGGQYLQNVILVGEYLGFGGVADYAASYLEELIDGSDSHGYTTTGFPSNVYNIDELFDRDWSGNDWPRSELVSRINNGLHIVNHLGHGSPDYAMKMYNSHVLSELTNTDINFVYSQTCLAGYFDSSSMDCWAEHVTIKTDNGAFAAIMNARYGWGELNSTDGASQRFNREFWDAIFSPAEGKPELGRANHDSKEDNLYRIDDDCMRWCYYELNLFGDPTISIGGVAALSFGFPNGVPDIIPPNDATDIEVVITGVGDGVLVPGSAQVHYKINDGTLQTDDMTMLTSMRYRATLPVVSCGDKLEYYFSAEEEANGRMYYPNPSSPYQPVIATGLSVAFADDFETDQGWTISGGSWGRGTPTGGGGSHGNTDPSSAHGGSSVFGYNLSGDYENNMSERHITSPAIDCGGITGTRLTFWRWLGVESSLYDHAYVRISTNGTNWTNIWENSGEITDGAWTEMTYDISEYADNQSTVYIRFTMGITDGGWVYCGWNIDDLEVSAYECNLNAPIITTETLPDWTAGHAYSRQLTASGGSGTLLWSDINLDLIGTGLTLSSSGLLSGTPLDAGTVSFTARVTDEAMQSDEKPFSFTINQSLAITTSELPDWTAGSAYSQQLAATGGTGTKAWIDLDDDLDGTGLSLSEIGLVSGTPLTSETVSFTARVSDGCGDYEDKLFEFILNPTVEIITADLSDGTVGEEYSQQLEAAGGTGTLTWGDRNDDLEGTGLTLSTTGLLSGIPMAEGLITFTARAADFTGSYDEKIMELSIGPNYLCGDADGNETINILDVTFMITYLYKSGFAPDPLISADTNGDGAINILDVTYLISYIYIEGPVPICQ
nr:choice-of-anchor J domain-containing protein [candidate division Zixibacteria bacterium]